MANKKTRYELENENENLRLRLHLLNKSKISNGFTRVFEKLIFWVGMSICIVGPFYFLTDFVGETTNANIIINLKESFSLFFTENPASTTKGGSGFNFNYIYGIVTVIAILFGMVGWLRGSREKKLRLEKTEYFQGRIKKLEEEKDPYRSSSNLHPTGETNPEDM